MSDGFQSLVGLVELLSQNVKHVSRRLTTCETCIQQLAAQVAQMEERCLEHPSCGAQSDAGKRSGLLNGQAEASRNTSGVEQVLLHTTALSKGLQAAREALDASLHNSWRQQVGDPVVISDRSASGTEANWSDVLAGMEPKRSFESFSTSLTKAWTSFLESGSTSDTGGESPVAGERGLPVCEAWTSELHAEGVPTLHMSKPVTTMLFLPSLDQEVLPGGAG